ncbi:aminoacetone oxidase family FAD-binding enzyme [Candidatus Nomurabacteria bacterium]|nr:aminoacetone oxidase family FAD-binding enzyme [Candidatus Nomurabacteria bacterium]
MEKNSKIWDVIVVGGGASGMMAASVAASLGKSVLIIEKNKSLGEKLKITGGGRCNITNGEEDIRVFLSHYGVAEQFLYSAFSRFGAPDTFSYFEKRGLPLVIQARKRAFPHTERAIDVYNVLQKELDKYKVTVKTLSQVKKIHHHDGQIQSIETQAGKFFAKSYILATGGMSHPETGATGDGFVFLKDLGHSIKEPTPSIVPVEVSDAWVRQLAGVSLSFMKITFFQDNTSQKTKAKKFSKTGKVLFTHFGLSGPLILNSATKIGDFLQEGQVQATIDAYPDTNHGMLEDRLIKLFDVNKNKILRTVFKEIAPEGTARVLESVMPDVDFEKKVHSVTKEQRKIIVHTLKALPLTITNLMGYDRAVVADGGVILSEVDMKTMRSKLFDNLYVTGDLLNINRPSGGYGLQLCWTSGFIAGTEA